MDLGISRTKNDRVETPSSEELRQYIDLQEKINAGLRKHIGEMGEIFRFIEAVNSLDSVDRILVFLMDVMQEMFHYRSAALFLQPQVELDAPPRIAREMDRIPQARRRAGIEANIIEWVLAHQRPILLPGDLNPAGTKAEVSYLLAPLEVPNEKLGWLEMEFDRPPGTFTQQVFSILEVLLKHAAFIILNERIAEQEKLTLEKHRQLEKMQKDIITLTSHEIKTPLTILIASSALLKQGFVQSPEAAREMLDGIVQQCERINLIVNELSQSQQLDEALVRLQPENLSLADLTRETLKEFELVRGKINFLLRFATDNALIKADRQSLRQVLKSLIENAIKYSPNGGEVVISLEEKNQEIIWSIQDPGIGIDKLDQKKIFDKFYRVGDSTTRRVGGIGFGLYLAKKNAELNRGTLTVCSQLGEGSTFTLVLPKYEPSGTVPPISNLPE